MSEFRTPLDWLHRTTLTDGTPVVMRPLRADDSSNLVRGLQGLSPEARYQRFLYIKHSFTPSELHYLTACDGVNHLALGMALSDEHGAELQPIAVARWVRDEDDPTLAEVAVVVADAWQGKGAGKVLFGALAAQARNVGIQRWQALLLNNNAAAFRLMEMVGTKWSQQPQGSGATLVTYTLHPASELSVSKTPSRKNAARHWLTLVGGVSLLGVLLLFATHQLNRRKAEAESSRLDLD